MDCKLKFNLFPSFTQAMVQNWENVMITSDKFIVDEFHKEFFAIWNHVHVVEFK